MEMTMNTLVRPGICLLLLGALLSLASCATGPSAVDDPVSKAIANKARSAADLERDARSRPDLVLPLLNVSPGDTVLDFFEIGRAHV